MAYDEKFRLAVIKFKDGGHTFAQTREIFGVHPQSYYRRKEELSENGVIKNHYPRTHKGKIDPVRLLKLLDEHPDWYLERFAAEFGVCRQAVQKGLPRLGLPVKKTFTYSGKSEEEREEYLKLVTRIPGDVDE